MSISALLLAGGTGTRYGKETPKQWELLRGKPLLSYSYEALCSHPLISEVIVVTEEQSFELRAAPGERRQDSVRNGALLAKGEMLLIHDSARPLLSHEMIDQLLLSEGDAIAPALPATDTIRQKTEEGLTTLPRGELFLMQTPQLVDKALLLEGLAKESLYTDDASVIEAMGGSVTLIPGDPRLHKLTTKVDLKILEALLDA